MKTVQTILLFVSAASFAVACKPAIRDPAAAALSTPVDSGESRTLDITLPFPGLGYYSGLTGSLSGADVCSGKMLFGEEGMAVCQQGVAATPASAAHVLNGREFWDSTGAKVTGTMPLGADVAGANGQRVIPIPAGYYDGSKTVTATDANLLAANIASGVTIFGTTGTAGLETHVACTASGQSGCVSNASFLAGAPQGNASGANGQLSFLIPQGYYDGTKSATAADAALLAGNIRAGATIFGVAGSVVAESHGNCSANGESGCVATASYLAGAPAAANFNGADGEKVILPPVGYYDGTTKTVTAVDADLVAENIVSGVSIFGVAGSATASPAACLSGNQSDCVANATFPSQSTPATPAAAANVLTGKQFYAGGAMITGTMADNGAPSIMPSTADQPLSAGYYSGGMVQGDADLVAEKILSGTTIFGVAGSATPAFDACSDDALNAGQCSTAAGRYVTSTLGSAISGVDGSLSRTIPQGYYDGTTSATMSDADLLAANIKSGVNVFGVAGNLTPAYGACTDNALNAGQCSTAAGRYVASVLGGAVTGANGSLTKAIPQGFYDGSTSCSMSDTNLMAENIVLGVTIFGITGSAAGSPAACLSGNQTNCVANATFPSQSTPATPAAAAEVLTGKQFYAGGAMVTGSMPNNGAPTITPSAVDQSLSAGYYSGGTVQGDADLLAANIKSGVNVFGVAGSLTEAYGGCTDNALNAAQCSTAAGRYVTATLGGALSGANGSLSRIVPQGYYDGTTTVTMSDTNLAADKILSGTTIFGVAGSATASPAACLSGNQTNCVASASFPSQSTPATPAAAGEVLTGKQFYAGGAMVTGSMPNNGSPTITPSTADQSLSAGYYSGGTVQGDADLVAEKILSGTTIFGVAGSATAAFDACSDDALNAGQCSTAAGRYVTSTLGGAISGVDGSLSRTIPQGYYDGTTSATMSDADLLAANIKSGVNVFGVAGSLTEAFGACSDNALNAAQCSTAAGRYVTSTLGGAISGVDGSLSRTIPQGYYDGTTSATMSDADLLAANIKSGVNVFGVAGNLTPAYGACTDNALNAGQCSTAAGRYVASVLGGAVTGANGSLTKAIPQGFYDGSTSCSMSDTNLMAENIVLGVTIFGITGSAAGSPAACLSGNQTNCVANATFPSQSTPATPAAAAEVLTGKQFYAGGAMVTGSMANNGAPTITPSAVDQSLSAGYYSGGTVQGDADLVATNILSGKTIFGVVGNATAAFSACSDNALNAGQCSTAAGRYVTSTLGSSISGVDGSLSRTIPQGYYDGTTSATMSDADLLAANIKSGVNVFGVAGNLTPAYGGCTDNALNAGQCSTAAGRYVASALGGEVTGVNGSLTKAIPQGFYDGSTSCTMSDTNLAADKILSGTTIFGVAGSATASPAACLSGNQTNCVASASFPSQSTPATPAAAAEVLTGKQFYAGGAMVTGSMPNNGAPTITPSTADQSLSAGYYSGGTVQGDADLLAANIKSGVNVFGVAGSLTPAYGACTDNTLNAAQCSTAAGRYVTSTLGASISGVDGSLSRTIPQGYYDGTTSATMSDTNLAADKILSGTTIFGVAGSATASPAACLSGNQTNCVANATFPSQSTPATPAGAADVVSGRQFYAGGAMVTGSMANNGAPTITPSTADQTLTAGYYSGGTVKGDADLVAANIVSGVTIFGVTGSASGGAYAACTDNTLNATQCSTALGRYVTATLGSSISGVDGSLSRTIPQGFYDGTTTATMSDSDLIAANIKSGVNIFGVNGTATVLSGTTVNGATAADIIAGKEAWDNTGTKLTGTMPNRGNLDVSSAWPGGGYYGNLPTNAPDASQLCRGTSVLGTAGTASCETSSAFRDQSVTQISQGVETSTYAGAALPAGYRDIPDITKDDNGFQAFGTASPQFTLATRPTVNCGTTQNTIAARIADCVAQNGAAATWDGTVKGNGGQTVWKLVTRAAADKEVWQDQGTGLLWSSLVGSDNWCRAAGNGQSTSNGYAANDPSTYCNKATNQPNYNASSPWAVQSWCVESGPVTLVPAAGSGETWGATPTYSTAKGGMGLTATATSPSVRWRLPTNNDYNIADAHGIRLVMPEMVAAGGIAEWTATVVASNRNLAYTFNAAGGDRYTGTRSSSNNLRCVGR